MTRIAGIAASILCGIAGRAGAQPPASAETELTAEELGWPAGTSTIELRAAATVYAGPGRSWRGRIAEGTRLGFGRIVAGRRACRAWIELDAGGWLCAANGVPSAEPPQAVAHPVDKPPAHTFADVVHSTPAYDTVDEIRAGTASRTVPGQTYVRYTGAGVTVDGVRYARTDHGLLAAAALVKQSQSAFAGIDLAMRPAPGWPFAWLVAAGGGAAVAVLDAPGGKVVGSEQLRAIAAVLAEKDGFVRIGTDRWVDAKDARIARIAAPPAGLAADERWIDVDMPQQVLIAYVGTTPVYATLVSTGSARSGTPTGVYRIRSKIARAWMSNPAGGPNKWSISDVPFAMSFRKRFLAHGVYWHDAFGKARSHGCVNLAPADARWIYGWSLPAVPDGWIEVRAAAGAGTPIRLRSQYVRDPPWKGFEGDVVTAAD